MDSPLNLLGRDKQLAEGGIKASLSGVEACGARDCVCVGKDVANGLVMS